MTPLSATLPPKALRERVMDLDVDDERLWGPRGKVDDNGNSAGYEGVFTRLEAATAHYETAGPGAEFASRRVR